VPIEELEAATAAYPVCAYGTDNWFFNLNGDYFDWETVSQCNIAESGPVRHRTHVWRSSWRGWVGYMPAWSTSGYSSKSRMIVRWASGCGTGGTFDYVAAVRIYAANVGFWSTTIYQSGSNIRRACGKTATW
jgi:hypothetical protein